MSGSPNRTATRQLQITRGTDTPPPQGHHSPRDTQAGIAAGSVLTDDALTRKAIAEVVTQGMKFNIPKWVQSRGTRAPSILILADSQFAYWPSKDKLCTVEVRSWPLKHWAQAIKMGEILINRNTVILYLESTCNWADVPLSRMGCSLCVRPYVTPMIPESSCQTTCLGCPKALYSSL